MEAKKSCDKATKEKDAKVKETDLRVKDLMSVLDKYKKEKEEILQQKSDEVVKIKNDLEKKTSTVQVCVFSTLRIAKLSFFSFSRSTSHSGILISEQHRTTNYYSSGYIVNSVHTTGVNKRFLYVTGKIC